MADVYFWRQCFVLSAGLLYSISVGFTLTFPAVLNPAILSDNSTDIRTTSDHASWIAAINGIGGLLGSFGLSPIMQTFGRKVTHYSLNASLLIGWIIFIFAKNVAALYIARFIQGISIGNIFINSIMICEFVHPIRRGYFITLKKVTIALGTLCCHAMGAFWTWREIATFAAIPAFVAIILTIFWPESPSYLALKGRFSECETAFKWLNGNSNESQNQLKLLVEAQRERIKRNKNRNNSLVKVLTKFLMKDFLKAFLITSVLTLSLDLCGRYYFIAYANQIMMELLGNKLSALYFTLVADIFITMALLLSTVVVRYAKRRTVLFSSGVCAVLLMLLISVLVYLKTVLTFSTYFLWFTALVIIIQCFVVNIGLIPIAFTLSGEIFPLEHKGLGACASGVMFTILYAVSLKITPVLIEKIGLYGTYASYGVALAICLMVLYKTVPETKDRTLQDIEDEMIGVQSKELISRERKRLVHSN